MFEYANMSWKEHTRVLKLYTPDMEKYEFVDGKFLVGWLLFV